MTHMSQKRSIVYVHCSFRGLRKSVSGRNLSSKIVEDGVKRSRLSRNKCAVILNV